MSVFEKLKDVRVLTRTAILLAVALIFQLGGFHQFVTGPVVNAVLFLAALIVGMWPGVIIGVFTPVIAFLTGILPPALSPMIPFIALGNALLVIVFFLLQDKSVIAGIVGGAILKFVFLAAAVRLLVDVPEALATMMTFPQLFTALGGGIVALLVYKALQAADIEGI